MRQAERMISLQAQVREARTAHERTVVEREIEGVDGQIDTAVYELYAASAREKRVIEEATSQERRRTAPCRRILDIIYASIMMSNEEDDARMKARTMVYLEADQLRALKEEASGLDISLAELMRRIVRAHLSQKESLPVPSRDVFLRIVGLGQSGCGDVSERHDAYLGGILRDEHSR